ncbi:MAG: dTMP kinase [Rhodospirillales bacterium]|nr:dTMP kinase [Rhodospirillales bacterium]
MARGKFITLEGGEGAGKSTQARLLGRGLSEAGQPTVVTREPGGAPGAEDIRGLLVTGAVGRWDPMSEALLHSAARHEHVTKTIQPALDSGTWVISDRFADSTMAYQGYGHGLGRQVVEGLNEWVLGAFAPDLTLILDMDVDDGLARAVAGAEDRYERMGRDFHQRLRDGFLEIASREPGRCAVIDAGAGVEEVQAAINAVVRERLGAQLP